MPAETFEQRTRALLLNRPRTCEYTHITAATHLTAQWISNFAQQHDRDYGIKKVQRLHDFLLSLATQAVA